VPLLLFGRGELTVPDSTAIFLSLARLNRDQKQKGQEITSWP